MDGTELADSIIVNPHKWMFVPLDFSVLFVRQPGLLRSVFALTPGGFGPLLSQDWVGSEDGGVEEAFEPGPAELPDIAGQRLVHLTRRLHR